VTISARKGTLFEQQLQAKTQKRRDSIRSRELDKREAIRVELEALRILGLDGKPGRVPDAEAIAERVRRGLRSQCYWPSARHRSGG
jgi:hypothetical protein